MNSANHADGSKMKLLTSRGEARIAQAIRKVLDKENGRRVILAAFVGKDCDKWVDHWDGVELWCWAKEGGTHPEAIALLLELGVDVQFCDKLHAKVYWSHKGGALIGSANLTNNALGEEGLFEAAWQLPAGVLNINDLIDAFGLQKNTRADVLKELNELWRRHRLLPKPNKGTKRGSGGTHPNTKPQTYLSWFESKAPTPWQFSTWYETADAPSDLTIYRRERGQEEPAEWNLEHNTSCLKLGVPAVYLKLNNQTDRPYKFKKQPYWWIPTDYFKTRDSAYKEHPHVFFSEENGLGGASPPFDCNDSVFLDAVDHVVSQNRLRWPARPITVETGFAKQLRKAYEQMSVSSKTRN